MQRRNARDFQLLIVILILFAMALYAVWPSNPGIHIDLLGLKVDRDLKIVEGLDLQGGLQVQLLATTPDGSPPPRDSLEAAKVIVENRINGLGVTEPLVQIQGNDRIIVEIPGVKDPEEAIKAFGSTGLLEIIDTGASQLPVGTVVTTTLGGPASIGLTPSGVPLTSTTPVSGTTTPTATTSVSGTTPAATTPTGAAVSSTTPTTAGTPAATVTGTTTVSGTTTPTATQTVSGTQGITTTAPVTTTPSSGGPVYTTVISGTSISDASVGVDPTTGKLVIDFKLRGDGVTTFGNWTTNNVGKYLSIVLDKKVIQSAVIQSPITTGSGQISGNFALPEAQSIVIQLKYGSLPVPLHVVENRTVGATLGAESVHRSIIAGIVGFLMVIIFMVVYYRLPGLIADLALIIYATLVFAIFKFLPVTLTLPGIAGFILSIGMAVDANILIFERMKEELRAGKSTMAALSAGFHRAWTSIRDSNISTLLTCLILFWFGTTFGASIIRGFALTLAIGVLVSLFTAVTVTQTFMRLLVRGEGVHGRTMFGTEGIEPVATETSTRPVE